MLTLDEPKYNTNTLPRLPFLKPKPSTGSAFCPVVSKSVSYSSGKRASICSQEVSRTMSEFKNSLNDSIASQLLIKSIQEGRPQSPVPDDKGQDFTSAEIPHEVQSLPQNNDVKEYSKNKSMFSPPETPLKYHSDSKSTVPQSKKESIIEVEPPIFTNTFKNNFQTGNGTSQSLNEYSEFAELKYLPKFHGEKGLISIAMEVAPDRPFTPVAITEPIIKPTPWVSLPVENENRPESPFVAALKTAPEKVYSPLPTFTYASELEPTPVEDPVIEVKKSIFETPALVQNSNFKASELGTSTRPVGNNPVRYMHGYNNRTPAKSPQVIAYSKPVSSINSQKGQSDDFGMKSYSFLNDQSAISRPYEPVLYKSNYSEPLITSVPNFIESEKSHPNHVFKIADQTIKLNHSQNQSNILTSQQLLNSDGISAVNRPLAPGIKNKVTTFTPGNFSNNQSLIKQTSNDQYKEDAGLNKNFASNVDGSFKYKSDHPNSVKLIKAVPFFSNNASFPSSS